MIRFMGFRFLEQHSKQQAGPWCYDSNASRATAFLHCSWRAVRMTGYQLVISNIELSIAAVTAKPTDSRWNLVIHDPVIETYYYIQVEVVWCWAIFWRKEIITNTRFGFVFVPKKSEAESIASKTVRWKETENEFLLVHHTCHWLVVYIRHKTW